MSARSSIKKQCKLAGGFKARRRSTNGCKTRVGFIINLVTEARSCKTVIPATRLHGVITQNTAIFNETELSKIRCDSVKAVPLHALNTSTYGEMYATATSTSENESK